MMALMINRNKPRVMMVIGIVNQTNIGFRKVFNKANTMATMMVVFISAISTPGKKYAATNAATAVIRIFMMIPICKLFLTNVKFFALWISISLPIQKNSPAPGIS